MSRFQRRFALPLGVAVLFLGVGGIVFAGETDPWTTAAAALYVPAGVAYLCSSRLDRIRVAGRTVRWQQLNGVGTVLLALGWVLSTGPTARSSPAFALAAGVGGLSLAFLGVQSMVDGPHVALDHDPSRRRLVSILALVVGAVALGAGIAITV